MACGDEDPRYGATLIYFKQGRAAGKPWQWVSLAKTGHQGSLELDEFVRKYFSAILSPAKAPSLWTDIDREEKVSVFEQTVQPSLTGWLPSEKLFDEWKRINEP